IYASPIAICKIPHRNPEIIPPFNPHRNATIKIGIIAKEIDPPAGQILNFKNGIMSRTNASAVKIAISIKYKVRLELIKITPPYIFFATKKAMLKESFLLEIPSTFNTKKTYLFHQKSHIPTLVLTNSFKG